MTFYPLWFHDIFECFMCKQFRKVFFTYTSNVCWKLIVCVCNDICLTFPLYGPGSRTSPEFQKLLGIAMEMFLLCSDDSESDVRMVADECLNKIIKVSRTPHCFLFSYFQLWLRLHAQLILFFCPYSGAFLFHSFNHLEKVSDEIFAHIQKHQCWYQSFS